MANLKSYSLEALDAILHVVFHFTWDWKKMFMVIII